MHPNFTLDKLNELLDAVISCLVSVFLDPLHAPTALGIHIPRTFLRMQGTDISITSKHDHESESPRFQTPRLTPPVFTPPGLDSNNLLQHLPFTSSLKVGKRRLKYALKLERNPMEILTPTNTIFVRIPKNASNSIIKLFYDGQNYLPHSSALFYQTAFPNQFNRSLVYAALRNPLERFISAFNYYKYFSQNQKERSLMDNKLSHIDNLSIFLDYLDSFTDLSKAEIMKWHHFRPQRDFICDRCGNIIVDLLFPVENMTTGINVLSHYIGIFGQVSQENQSSKTKLSDYDLTKIQKYYQDDAYIWNYVTTNKVAGLSKIGTDAINQAKV